MAWGGIAAGPCKADIKEELIQMIHHSFLKCIHYHVFIFINVTRITLTAEQLHSSSAYCSHKKRNDFLPITHNQCCDWHYKLSITDKSHFKVKVIKITQVWETFTRVTAEHSDFSFSWVPVGPSYSEFVSLKRGKNKEKATAYETSNKTPQSSHLTLCGNTHFTRQSRSFLSRCQIRQEQAAFGQFFGMLSHRCRDHKKCKAFLRDIIKIAVSNTMTTLQAFFFFFLN